MAAISLPGGAGCAAGGERRAAEVASAPGSEGAPGSQGPPGSSGSSTAPGSATPSSKAGSAAVAEEFFAALRAGDVAQATSRFDATMKKALPAEQLAAIWGSQVDQLGPLVSWRGLQELEREGKAVHVLQLSFERGELEAMVAVDRTTLELAGVFFNPVAPPATSAPYVDAAAFRAVEVSLGSAPFLLRGTLTLPNGSGPFPGVVLVHGSGPHDRDETVAANRPFKDIAEGLSSRGVAVLRYDKRTYAHQKQLQGGVTLEQEVLEDAVLAVQLLQARAGVDPERVFVIGHSLGALLAPEIARRSRRAAGVVLLAPPGRAPWDMVLEQLEYLAVPKATLDEVVPVVERFRKGDFKSTLLGAPGSYWRELGQHDGVAISRRLRKPMLILRGERDYQVTEADLQAWKQGLAGRAHVQISTLPGLNHLFIRGTGKPGPAEYAVRGHVDAGVIEQLARFVSRPAAP